jgi:hypothetical protein
VDLWQLGGSTAGEEEVGSFLCRFCNLLQQISCCDLFLCYKSRSPAAWLVVNDGKD